MFFNSFLIAQKGAQAFQPWYT